MPPFSGCTMYVASYILLTYCPRHLELRWVEYLCACRSVCVCVCAHVGESGEHGIGLNQKYTVTLSLPSSLCTRGYTNDNPPLPSQPIPTYPKHICSGRNALAELCVCVLSTCRGRKGENMVWGNQKCIPYSMH